MTIIITEIMKTFSDNILYNWNEQVSSLYKHTFRIFTFAVRLHRIIRNVYLRIWTKILSMTDEEYFAIEFV